MTTATATHAELISQAAQKREDAAAWLADVTAIAGQVDHFTAEVDRLTREIRNARAAARRTRNSETRERNETRARNAHWLRNDARASLAHAEEMHGNYLQWSAEADQAARDLTTQARAAHAAEAEAWHARTPADL